MQLNMMFHEDTLKVFSSNRADTTKSQNILLSNSKGRNSKNIHIPELRFWFSTHCSIFVNTFMKFHEDILRFFIEIQSGHDHITNLLIINFKGR